MGLEDKGCGTYARFFFSSLAIDLKGVLRDGMNYFRIAVRPSSWPLFNGCAKAD